MDLQGVTKLISDISALKGLFVKTVKQILIIVLVSHIALSCYPRKIQLLFQSVPNPL